MILNAFKNHKLRSFAAFVIIMAGLTQFTNCGTYENQDAATGTSTLSCLTANCVTPTSSNLKITANLNNGVLPITANMSEFNVGGDCNEGGYPINIIHWVLTDPNGGSGRNSSQPIAQGTTADSLCINGAF